MKRRTRFFLPALVFALGLPVLTLAANPPPATEPAAPPAAPPKPPAPKPATERTEESAVTPVNASPARHAEFLARIQQGPVGLLFMGGSIIDFWPRRGEWTWLKFAPHQPADFGVAGERTEHLLWRVTNGELDGISPRVVAIQIGGNNFATASGEQPEWAAAGVRKIVETVHQKLPQARVLLFGITPRQEASHPIRAKIKAANDLIAKLDDGDKTRYLDVGYLFVDAQGEIPKELMPDGIHPSPQGYVLWYDAMRPLLEEMLK